MCNLSLLLSLLTNLKNLSLAIQLTITLKLSLHVRSQNDYYYPDQDFTVCQQKIEEQIKYTEYLIYSTSMKTYLKRGLRDGDVKTVFNTEGIEDDLRFCVSCRVDVCLGDWPEHITTYFHQINLKYKKRMWGCCWFKDKFIRPHQVKDCSTCKKQTELQKTKHNLDVEDMFFIKQKKMRSTWTT